MTFLAFSCGGGEHRIGIDPTRECIVSWSARQPIDIDVRAQVADGRRSAWLPYVRCNPWRSCSASDELVHIEVDILRSDVPMVAIEVRAEGINGVFLATPPKPLPLSDSVRMLTRIAIPGILDVPMFSQYIEDAAGWCAAASLAMVMVYWAQRMREPSYLTDVRSVAVAIYDSNYQGTGNWTFATAYACMRGLRGAVAFLHDLEHAHRFILAQIPLILSIAWEKDELAGAPLARSNGHLLVLRGFDREGFAIVNDPALPEISGRYRRDQLEAAWRRAGAVAYGIAPLSNTDLLPLLSFERL